MKDLVKHKTQMQQQLTFKTIQEAIGKPVICTIKKIERELTYREQKYGISHNVIDIKEVTVNITAEVMSECWNSWEGFHVNMVKIQKLLSPYFDYGFTYYYSIN